MRLIKIRFSSYLDVYIRKASRCGGVVEIQGRNGSIIVHQPKLRRTIRHGLVLLDHDRRDCTGISHFTDRTAGFEKNNYTIEHYWG